jgi:hypothetical protein
VHAYVTIAKARPLTLVAMLLSVCGGWPCAAAGLSVCESERDNRPNGQFSGLEPPEQLMLNMGGCTTIAQGACARSGCATHGAARAHALTTTTSGRNHNGMSSTSSKHVEQAGVTDVHYLCT